jgi:hypothetical protein
MHSVHRAVLMIDHAGATVQFKRSVAGPVTTLADMDARLAYAVVEELFLRDTPGKPLDRSSMRAVMLEGEAVRRSGLTACRIQYEPVGTSAYMSLQPLIATDD